LKTWLKIGLMLVSLIFICSNVFADIPNGTVVIGNEGYDIKYANKAENGKKIRKAIMDMGKDGKIFVKSFNGIWYANNGEKVEKFIIPVVDYNSKSGDVITYESGDREEFAEKAFKVINVSFLDLDHMEIIFSEPVMEKTYSENIKLSGYLDVKAARVEGNRIIVTLNEKMLAKVYEGKITISADIQNVDGESLGKEIQKNIYVINKDELSNETFDKNVCIISNGFIGKNLTFNGAVTICGDYVTLKDSKAKELSLNPGKGGSVILEGITAEKMCVFSGGLIGVSLKKCEIDMLQVKSNINTRIVDIGDNKVKSTLIESDVILETKNGVFEYVRILSSKQQKKVELRGKFKRIIAENNSSILSSDDSELEAIIVKGDCRLQGMFSTIDVQSKDSIIDIRNGTEIKKLTVNEKNLVLVLGKVRIGHLEGPSDKVSEVNKAIKAARRKANNRTPDTKNITVKVKDIQLSMTIRNVPIWYNGTKYKEAKMMIDLSNLELTAAEKLLGMSILIYDENNNLINAIQPKVIENKLENDKLFIRDGKSGKIVLCTEQKGKIEFVFNQ